MKRLNRGKSLSGHSLGSPRRQRPIAAFALVAAVWVMWQLGPANARAMDEAGANAPRLGAAGALIDKPVENAAGEPLGRVVDAVTVIDRAGERVTYAILSRVEVAAEDDRLYPVPTQALHFADRGESLLLDLSSGDLVRTGGFNADHWPRMTSRAWGERLHRRFGLTPYWLQATSGRELVPAGAAGNEPALSSGGPPVRPDGLDLELDR